MMEQIGAFFYKIVRAFSDSVYLAIIKEDRFEYLISGFQKSIQITLLAALLGITIGLLLAVAKLQGKGPLSTFESG